MRKSRYRAAYSPSPSLLGRCGHNGSALAKLKHDVLAESVVNRRAQSGGLPPVLLIPFE